MTKKVPSGSLDPLTRILITKPVKGAPVSVKLSPKCPQISHKKPQKSTPEESPRGVQSTESENRDCSSQDPHRVQSGDFIVVDREDGSYFMFSAINEGETEDMGSGFADDGDTNMFTVLSSLFGAFGIQDGQSQSASRRDQYDKCTIEELE